MRLILWAPVFAAAAGALPGRRSVPSSSSTPSSTSSVSSETSVPTSVNEGRLQYVCENGGPSQDAWNELDMGFFLNTTSMMWCEDEEKCPEGPYTMPFPQTLATLLPDQTVFECEIGNDDCDIKKDAAWCSNDLHAQTSFALGAVKHFHDYIQRVSDAIDDAESYYATMQLAFVEKFTTHDIEDDSSVALGATIAAGVFGAAAGLLGPLAPLAFAAGSTALTVATATTAGLGAAAGASTVTIGVANSMSKNVAEVLQNEITSAGNMSFAFSKAFTDAKMTINDFAANAINEIPTNDGLSTGYAYKDHYDSAPAILNSGAFAEPITWNDYAELIHITKMRTNMAAVGYLWRAYEKVYVAKLTVPHKGVDPCDIEIENLYRVCKDSKAYFFVSWEDKAKDDDEWTRPKGIDDIEELDDMDLFIMAEAAEWTQKAYGYGHEWDPETAGDALTAEDGPPGAAMINLPVCYMDDFMEYYTSDGGKPEHDIKAILHKECAAIPKKIKYWPYEFIGDDDVYGNLNVDPDTDDAQDSVIFTEGGSYLWTPELVDD